jgi:signal transduction histidine kinase/ActR/RegA family two-component response regulator
MTFLLGSSWGSSVLIVFPEASAEAKISLVLVIGGMSTAGVAVLAAVRAAFLSYMIPCLLPLIIYMWNFQQRSLYLMSIEVVVFCGCIYMVGVYVRKAIQRALRLGQENIRLIDTLMEANREAVSLNKELEMGNQILDLALRDAELANIHKREFLANTSHELRTPLNGIIGMNELALEGKLSEEQREYIQLSLVSARHLLSLLNDLLDFSAIESGKLELRKQHCNLRELLHEILAATEARLHTENVTLLDWVDPKLPASIVADPVRLTQIMHNLIGNAVKFVGAGGAVIIYMTLDSSWESGVAIKFTVADTGIGIPENMQHKIFESFVQVESDSTRSRGGAGLGLAICSRLVEIMEGKIWVESKVGVGSAFHCVIPFKVASQEGSLVGEGQEFTEILETDGSLQSGQVDQKTERSLRVLASDDNSTNRALVRAILEKLGHDVECVADGDQAVREVKRNHYDLILMDCQVPVLDGYQAAKLIRQDPARSQVPIVALTAHAHDSDRERCMQAGMNDFLTKPINREDLARVLDKVMANGYNFKSQSGSESLM